MPQVTSPRMRTFVPSRTCPFGPFVPSPPGIDPPAAARHHPARLPVAPLAELLRVPLLGHLHRARVRVVSLLRRPVLLLRGRAVLRLLRRRSVLRRLLRRSSAEALPLRSPSVPAERLSPLRKAVAPLVLRLSRRLPRPLLARWRAERRLLRGGAAVHGGRVRDGAPHRVHVAAAVSTARRRTAEAPLLRRRRSAEAPLRRLTAEATLLRSTAEAALRRWATKALRRRRSAEAPLLLRRLLRVGRSAVSGRARRCARRCRCDAAAEAPRGDADDRPLERAGPLVRPRPLPRNRGRPRNRSRRGGRQRRGRGALVHHHRPLELRGGGSLQLEAALRARLRGFGVLRTAIGTEHGATSSRWTKRDRRRTPLPPGRRKKRDGSIRSPPRKSSRRLWDRGAPSSLTLAPRLH